MTENIDGLILNQVLSLLLNKIIVPSDFHSKVDCVREMLEDDVSGLVDSLTDFAVDTASVDFTVETDNPELTKILKKWLDNINSSYKGQIPRGIKPLAEEYLKERWKNSSFPILKIPEWGTISGIKVPTKMFFVDGGSVYSEEIDKKKENKELISYKYALGKDKKDKLDKGVIITRPYGRWFDEYPNPYLIKRGVYHNWKIIQSLKSTETKILNQIIPYLFLVKKGSDALTTAGKIYTQPELQKTFDDFQKLMNKMQSVYTSSLEKTKTPIRVTQYDEEIKHLMPDLKGVFDPQLFLVAEKGILSGLGFIDVVEAVSTSRRESILNPKAFIEETKKGVEDFKKILNELVARIIEENKNHKKYMNATFYITSSPVKGFMTDKFKNQLRLMWERGQLSNRTYCEMVGEVEFRTEVARREKEIKDGTEFVMNPHQVRNQEQYESYEEREHLKLYNKKQKTEDKNGNPIPQDKLNDKEKYDIGALVTAPYVRITQLPKSVREKLSKEKQRAWMKIFNDAYRFYLGKFGDPKRAETLAFKTAWEQIKFVKSKKRGK